MDKYHVINLHDDGLEDRITTIWANSPSEALTVIARELNKEGRTEFYELWVNSGKHVRVTEGLLSLEDTQDTQWCIDRMRSLRQALVESEARLRLKLRRKAKSTVREARIIQKLKDSNSGYWGAHPDYPESDWRKAVAARDTKSGYWGWVINEMRSEGKRVE